MNKWFIDEGKFINDKTTGDLIEIASMWTFDRANRLYGSFKFNHTLWEKIKNTRGF